MKGMYIKFRKMIRKKFVIRVVRHETNWFTNTIEEQKIQGNREEKERKRVSSVPISKQNIYPKRRHKGSSQIQQEKKNYTKQSD